MKLPLSNVLSFPNTLIHLIIESFAYDRMKAKCIHVEETDELYTYLQSYAISLH